MLTPYPQIIEYNEAVQHPATAFQDPELRQGQVKVNALGLPVALSGGFALTYMLATRKRRLAVRCFHREIPRAQQKYAAIARAVGALKSPYFVGFDYLADGIVIRGGRYPVVKMDWAEGDPLGIWLDRNAADRRALEWLRGEFTALAAFLEKQGIAHGDGLNVRGLRESRRVGGHGESLVGGQFERFFANLVPNLLVDALRIARRWRE